MLEVPLCDISNVYSGTTLSLRDVCSILRALKILDSICMVHCESLGREGLASSHVLLEVFVIRLFQPFVFCASGFVI
jgi:hypothetical protein